MENRYAQQIMVEGFGAKGQLKLLKAKVLVIGAGGLGVPVCMGLAAAGIGTLGIVDFDEVAASNLHRQFMYNPSDIGKLKAPTLAQKLIAQNPQVQVFAYQKKMEGEMAKALVAEYDIVCDCTDNVSTRILIDGVCLSFAKPLVYAAVVGWEGYITVLHHANKISLSDIFSYESLEKHAMHNCSVVGIVNTSCGIAANIQVNEVIKILLGSGELLDGKLLCFNSLNYSFKKFKVNKRETAVVTR